MTVTQRRCFWAAVWGVVPYVGWVFVTLDFSHPFSSVEARAFFLMFTVFFAGMAYTFPAHA